MIELVCTLIVNTLGLIHALIGLPFVIGVMIVIASLGFVYNLGHAKTL